ncbi:MAG: ArsR family transcriptional regulator [Candidatus Paceibacterota bacterium]
MEAQIFKALGDPLRLKIVKRLSHGSDYTITTLTKDLGISRQGARKQLQVLATAKVLRLKPVGREVNVILNPAALESCRRFIISLEQQWDTRLNALKDVVERG